MTSTLVNPLTFQLTDTGVVLNDDLIVPNSSFVDIDKVSGLDSPPFRTTQRDHEGTDGGFMDAEFETGRDISLEGTVYGQGNLEPYLDSLKANWAPSSVLIPFYFMTEQAQRRVLYIKPLGCNYDWDLSRRLGITPVKFVGYAEDPRIYDDFVNSATFLVGATITTGFGFNLGFNFGFGGSSSSVDGQYLTNLGNRPTPATLTFTGPLDTPIVINDTTGDSLQFNIVLTASDVLVVDLLYRTVTLNDSANRRGTLVTPNWFLLAPGQNFLRFRAASGSGSLQIDYRNAWR